jgi:hypothetical protein
MNKYDYNDLTIEVFNEPCYKEGSADNKHVYSKKYIDAEALKYQGSYHGIKISNYEEEINSCLIGASCGSTSIFENSSLLDKDRLVICCADKIFCLSIPGLDLKWQTRADLTCLQIFKLEEDYLVHGEVNISRIDANGNIKWQFGGADIFISIESADDFKIETDHIRVVDFCNTEYKIDFSGNLISSFNLKPKPRS